MAARKPTIDTPPARPELDKLIEQAKKRTVTEEMLTEQRASFVYGNAPVDSKITKESARISSMRIKLSAA